MRKVTIRPVLVKSKVLADGRHTIRISVAHNNQTRYIVTQYIIPKATNFRRGEVVGLPNASYINRKLREMTDDLYKQCDDINGIEYISCSELVSILTKIDEEYSDSFSDVSAQWEAKQKVRDKETTMGTYKFFIGVVAKHFGEKYRLSLLTPTDVTKFQYSLKAQDYSPVSINRIISTFKRIVKYGITHNIVKYRIDPFIDVIKLHEPARDSALTVEELRAFRDAKHKSKAFQYTQKFFMLSFYLCGMNTGDIVYRPWHNNVIRYRRRKNDSRRAADEWTCFTVPMEARPIIADEKINKVIDSAYERGVKGIHVLHNKMGNTLKKINNELNAKRLIMYSARKTWAQLAAELGVQDCIIEYCLGDSRSSSTISYYRRVNQEMADEAINKVLSFVASDLSLKEYRERERRTMLQLM